ncbi:DUF6735 family protein [Halorientalis brevis]|uniref:DUF6735 family protein n=1 Tax=Halorientalis brevis TaxID=1126241 RepID=A0ABD6C988_9EURY|nr:DUF6735 family protein [Halorientalis brevis]
MGHRALIAYERPDSLYNLHYSHWGAADLRLKHAITPVTPFGGDEPGDDTPRILFDALVEAYDEETASTHVTAADMLAGQVDHDPLAIAITKEEILTEYLDFLHHEAFYVVDPDFQVTAYRTHWFGLQYDCETITESPTVGNGALRTVRWSDGEPVGDGYARGEFQALKDICGDLIDRDVFSPEHALEYMQAKLVETVASRNELIIRTPCGSRNSSWQL